MRTDSYDFIEMDIKSGEPTGRVLTFAARTVDQAAAQALAFARIKSQAAEVGKTGRVVYPLGSRATLAWVLPATNAQMAAAGAERRVVDVNAPPFAPAQTRKPQPDYKLVWVRRGAGGGSYELVDERPKPAKPVEPWI